MRVRNKGVLGPTRTQVVRFDWDRWASAMAHRGPAAGVKSRATAKRRPVAGPFTTPVPQMRWEPTSRCKRCGTPIVWGEVEETVGECSDKRRWIPFEIDGMPHECPQTKRRRKGDKAGERVTVSGDNDAMCPAV